MFNLKSIKFKVVISYLALIGFMMVIAAQVYIFNYKMSNLSLLARTIQEMMLNNVQIIKQHDLVSHEEIISSDLWEKEDNEALREHARYLAFNSLALEDLKLNPEIQSVGLLPVIHKLDEKYNEYAVEFQLLVDKYKTRGFKDYGLEGQMRTYIHELEADYPEFDRSLLLNIRRYEKDFLLRKDLEYVTKLNKLIYKGLKFNYGRGRDRDSKIKELLSNYHSYFNQIVFIENDISKKNEKVNVLFYEEIQSLLDTLNKTSVERIAQEINYLNTIFTIVLMISLGCSLFLGWYFARSITEPVKVLTKAVEKTVENNFKSNLSLNYPFGGDEIGVLKDRFTYMVNEIRTHLGNLNRQKELLEMQNHQLSSLNEELKATNEELVEKEMHIQRINTMKDKFFAILSHDLRGPLNSMKGLIDIITIDPKAVPEDIKIDAFNKIKKSVVLQIDLLNNLLDWSSVKVNEFNFMPENNNLHQLAENNLQLSAERANTKGIVLVNEVPENLEVNCDKNMVNFILRNLVSNAVKFTNSKGYVKIKALEDDDLFIKICIEDNGVGMNNENKNKIFKTGEHFSTSGTANEKGTGFGLLTCKEFVEKHGGTIWLESEENVGTQVYFTLVKNITSEKSITNKSTSKKNFQKVA
ncbi:MAG: ATP-binding protein [Cytophagales bacterium]|nr:ATP-binding protein [Cytophagales bacterium]